MRRARVLRTLTVIGGALTLLDLVALLIIVFRNSYTHGLITLVIVLGIAGIVFAGMSAVLLGTWREAFSRTSAAAPNKVDTEVSPEVADDLDVQPADSEPAITDTTAPPA